MSDTTGRILFYYDILMERSGHYPAVFYQKKKEKYMTTNT